MSGMGRRDLPQVPPTRRRQDRRAYAILKERAAMVDLTDVAIANQATNWRVTGPAPEAGPVVRQRKPRRARRPDYSRTRQQLLAHVCADALATAYSHARVTIGVEQVEINLGGEDYFVVLVKRIARHVV
jgi:hypothetical protein